MTSRQEPWTRLSHSKKLPGWVAYNPKTMRPPPLSGDTKQMKILSWNVNGLSNIVQSGGFSTALAQRENFDVLCLQETHLKEGDVKDFKNLIPGYEYNYWPCSVARLDYSGTGVISREDRVITLEFENFYVVNAYVPNSGRGLRRLEGVKLLGTWLEGDRTLTFCRLLARNTVRAKPSQLAFEATWE
ncbi:hypothetical protein ZWY2020_021815 [Hordeum vulgare]|nr:hypothetical protein ZWY2020_021815 [Hordeum vulgare]